MKKYAGKLFRYLKTKAGFDEQEKRAGYQSALLHLGLPEILVFDDRMLLEAREKIRKEFGVADFGTAVQKNDMMFNYRLYNHYGDLRQSLYSYFWVGANLMKNLQGVAKEHQLKSDKILDFGAGYGRVSRFWRHFFPVSEISVSDLKLEAIHFQKEQFGFKPMEHSPDPASFPPGKFDLILAVSVFTHLPKGNFQEWMEKLAKALNPNGALIFTFNDIHSDSNQKLIGKRSYGEFHFLENSEETIFPFISDSNTKTSEYGHAFVSEKLLRESAEEHGLQAHFLHNRLAKNQETVLLKKVIA